MVLPFQRADRIDRVGGAQTVDLNSRDGEARVRSDPLFHHRIPILFAHPLCDLLVRGYPAGDEDYLGEPELLDRRTRHEDMRLVQRVERPAEEPYPTC